MPRSKKNAAKVVTLRFDDNRLARDLFGAEDNHLKLLEKNLDVNIDVRGADLKMKGSGFNVETGEKVLNELYELLKKGYPIMGSDIEMAFKVISRDRKADLQSLFADTIFLPARGKAIIPQKTPLRKSI